MDLDPFEDMFVAPTTTRGPPASKFKPKVGAGAKKGSLAPGNSKEGAKKSLEPVATVDNDQNVDVLVQLESLDDLLNVSINGAASEGATMISPTSMDIENHLDLPVDDSLHSSTLTVTDAIQSESFPCFTVIQESVTIDEDGLLLGGDSHIDKEILEAEEAEAFPGLAAMENFPDSVITSSVGQRRGKFPPKKVIGGAMDPGSGFQHPAAKDDDIPDLLVDIEAEFVSEGDPSPASVPEDVFDYSFMMLDGSTAGDQVTQPPDSEILEDPSEPSSLGASLSADAGGAEGGMLRNSSQSKRAAAQDFSRKMRKRVASSHHVDDLDGEAQNNLSPEPESSSYINGEPDVDETGEKSALEEERAPKNSKTSKGNGEKPVRKGKGAKVMEQPNEGGEPSKKKFTHSSRRSRRCVDKVLLQTLEEETDYRTLRMKDLILLAEHREKLVKKNAKTSKKSSGSQSAEKSLDGNDSQNAVAPEESVCADQETDDVQPSVTLFNYQSFMDKTPSTRWSKQDTELFYEGIRQFGTDLSMIKELFPNLTRNQIKLKFKKEERQNPLRLSEAVKGRAKDHRHFKLVIDRLKVAAQAERESNPDESAGMTAGEEEEDQEQKQEQEQEYEREQNTEMKKEAAKCEKEEEKEYGNPDGECQSSLDPDEIDDDIFNLYKSEF